MLKLSWDIVAHMKFGLLLKSYRKVNGLSLADLAKEVGIERTAIFRIENGRNVNIAKWRKFLNWVLS